MSEKQNHKLIFLDIDGTIYNNIGIIPESAKEAIKKARKNGHKIFISTGRNKSQITDEIMNLGVDGIIASAGAFVELEGQLIVSQPLEQSLLNELYDYLLYNKIIFTLETDHKMYGTRTNINKQIKFLKLVRLLRKRKTKSLDIFIEMMTIVEDIKKVKGVKKVLFYNSKIPIKVIKKEFEDRFTVISSSIGSIKGESGEIYGKTISKATGIQIIVDYLGVSTEDTIAFGDGENDFEMLEFAGIGVAMGNAVEDLKKVANFVTTHVSDNGIYNGFQKCGLI